MKRMNDERMLHRIGRWNNHRNRKSLLLISTSDRAADAVRSLQKDFCLRYITGIAIIDCHSIGERIQDIPVVADADTVIHYLTREWVDEVFFCIPAERPEFGQLLSSVMKMGITVHMDAADRMFSQNAKVRQIGEITFRTISFHSIDPMGAFVKRGMDIIGGMFGSVIALILIGIFTVPLKRQSPGPILYRSERIGLNGKRFRMYKIRSMYQDADRQKAELMKNNMIKDGLMFRVAWDPRIIGNRTLEDGTRQTGIGAFLRDHFIDEFPQFFNVLKGDMSLVGTRPPTVDEWEKYRPHHRARMSVKPGLTGMWQVYGRTEVLDFEQVVRLDTDYIRNWSLKLDAQLLLKTMGILLK